jgi:hypothetical protein
MRDNLNFLLFTIVLFFPTLVFSQLDYKVENLIRTFPIAFYLKANMGYSIPIYGKGEKVLFGYIRPSASFQTAAIVNTGRVQLDFNPISIMNFYFGKSLTKRNFENLSNFDCDSIICSADIKRDHYGMRVALKYKSIYYSGALNYNVGELDQVTKGDWADELSSLVNTGSKSIMVQQLHIIGHALDEKFSVGYLGLYNKMNNNRQSSSMHIAFGKYVFNNQWDIIAGSGIFKTRIQKKNLTALSLLTWKPKKGLPLF